MLNSHHNTLGRNSELKTLIDEDGVARTYRVVHVPRPICMECGEETINMYPICNDCAEEV